MKSWRIRHLPVLNENGRVAGVLSDRDVQRAMLPLPGNGTATPESHWFDPQKRVKDYMTSPVQTIEEGCTVEAATRKMLSEKRSCLIVVDQRGAPVGIVTTDDLLGYLLRTLEENQITRHENITSFVKEYWFLDEYQE